MYSDSHRDHMHTICRPRNRLDRRCTVSLSGYARHICREPHRLCTTCGCRFSTLGVLCSRTDVVAHDLACNSSAESCSAPSVRNRGIAIEMRLIGLSTASAPVFARLHAAFASSSQGAPAYPCRRPAGPRQFGLAASRTWSSQPSLCEICCSSQIHTQTQRDSVPIQSIELHSRMQDSHRCSWYWGITSATASRLAFCGWCFLK